MIKIHLILKKEEINEEELANGKIAVVFDVLLATSTITSALQYGAKAIIPVLNEELARKEAGFFHENECVLVGEFEGKTIEGFLDPNPAGLKNKVKNKIVILSTTNGTVAIQKSKLANKVYACCLLNGHSVAEKVLSEWVDETIILVCSGSSGQFCLEDFYGAGYFIECLSKHTSLELTDSARAAHFLYKGYEGEAAQTLLRTRVGQMLKHHGYEEEVNFVSQKGIFSVVPIFQGNEIKGGSI